MLEDAEEFLRNVLADGPVPVAEAQAKENQITSATLRRAKAALRVKSTRDRDSWLWALPEHVGHC